MGSNHFKVGDAIPQTAPISVATRRHKSRLLNFASHPPECRRGRPARPGRAAVARPMPPVPPVTSAVLPAIGPGKFSVIGGGPFV